MNRSVIVFRLVKRGATDDTIPIPQTHRAGLRVFSFAAGRFGPSRPVCEMTTNRGEENE